MRCAALVREEKLPVVNRRAFTSRVNVLANVGVLVTRVVTREKARDQDRGGA